MCRKIFYDHDQTGDPLPISREIPRNIFSTLNNCFPFIEKVFPGNNNANGYVKNLISKPFRCIALRIRPIGWEQRPAMRTELYGCDVFGS